MLHPFYKLLLWPWIRPLNGFEFKIIHIANKLNFPIVKLKKLKHFVLILLSLSGNSLHFQMDWKITIFSLFPTIRFSLHLALQIPYYLFLIFIGNWSLKTINMVLIVPWKCCRCKLQHFRTLIYLLQAKF